MQKLPIVTIIAILSCVGIYLGMELYNKNLVLRWLFISIIESPYLYEIKNGEWWRLLSPALLHFSWFHLLFNMAGLWMLARPIEWRQGPGRLLLLIIVCGVISNLMQYYTYGFRFGGMSGVLYALFGYLWVQGHFNPAFGLRLPQQLVNMVLIWFLICWSGVLDSIFGISVANMGHTSGLLSGLAAGFFFAWFQTGEIKRISR